MELLTLHLFSGAGGGILADKLLGFRPIGAVECDDYCRRLYHLFLQEVKSNEKSLLMAKLQELLNS